jgi:hypothetical protein
MSAIEHMRAALERFKTEDSKDALAENYELNDQEGDREGHHPEYPSGSTEPSTGASPVDL